MATPKDLAGLTDEALIVEYLAARRAYRYAYTEKPIKEAYDEFKRVVAEADARGLSLAEYSDDQDRDESGKWTAGGGGGGSGSSEPKMSQGQKDHIAMVQRKTAAIKDGEVVDVYMKAGGAPKAMTKDEVQKLDPKTISNIEVGQGVSGAGKTLANVKAFVSKDPKHKNLVSTLNKAMAGGSTKDAVRALKAAKISLIDDEDYDNTRDIRAEIDKALSSMEKKG